MAWMVARTKPLYEQVAQRQCRREGITTYLPKFFNEQARRKQVLFGCYLFVKYQRGLATEIVRSIKPIIYVLMQPGSQGTEPATLPEDFVRQLKKRTVMGLVQFETSKPIPLKMGGKVKITKGAFEDQFGILDEE